SGVQRVRRSVLVRLCHGVPVLPYTTLFRSLLLADDAGKIYRLLDAKRIGVGKDAVFRLVFQPGFVEWDFRRRSVFGVISKFVGWMVVAELCHAVMWRVRGSAFVCECHGVLV